MAVVLIRANFVDSPNAQAVQNHPDMLHCLSHMLPDQPLEEIAKYGTLTLPEDMPAR